MSNTAVRTSPRRLTLTSSTVWSSREILSDTSGTHVCKTSGSLINGCTTTEQLRRSITTTSADGHLRGVLIKILDYLPHVVDIALSSDPGTMALELMIVGVVFIVLFNKLSRFRPRAQRGNSGNTCQHDALCVQLPRKLFSTCTKIYIRNVCK